MATAEDRDDVLVIDPDWMLFPIMFRAVLGALFLLIAAALAVVATGTGAAGRLVLDLSFWHLGDAAAPAYGVLALASAIAGGWNVWIALRSYTRRHELKIDLRADRIVLRGRAMCRPTQVEAVALGMIGEDAHYSDLAYHQVLARLKGGGFRVLAVYMEADPAAETASRIAAFLDVTLDPIRAATRRLW